MARNRLRTPNSPIPGQGTTFSLKFKNPLTKVRLAQAMGKVKGLLGMVTEIAHVVNDMGPNPGLRNYAALGIVALSKLIETTEFNPHDDPRFEWLQLPYELRTSISHLATKIPATRALGSGECFYRVTDLGDGALIVFQMAADGKDAEGQWFVSEDLSEDEILKRLGRELWKILGSRITVSVPGAFETASGEIFKWNIGEIYTSPQSKQILTRVRTFLKAGHSRAIMLHGEPGTGKSCMVRTIAEDLKSPTLFLDQRDVQSISILSLHGLLSILCPDVVIIDDFDRIRGSDELLGTLDRIRESTKLLLVTVNNLDWLDSAIKRAGRFDDIIKVDRVRSSEDIIPELSAELYEELDAWPIAFVEELRLRLDALGEKSLDIELESLRERVKANKNERSEPLEKTESAEAPVMPPSGRGKDMEGLR